jgi:hypothetical protein
MREGRQPGRNTGEAGVLSVGLKSGAEVLWMCDESRPRLPPPLNGDERYFLLNDFRQ